MNHVLLVTSLKGRKATHRLLHTIISMRQQLLQHRVELEVIKINGDLPKRYKKVKSLPALIAGVEIYYGASILEYYERMFVTVDPLAEFYSEITAPDGDEEEVDDASAMLEQYSTALRGRKISSSGEPPQKKSSSKVEPRHLDDLDMTISRISESIDNDDRMAQLKYLQNASLDD